NTTRSIREQSRAILGGDLAFSARQAFAPPVVALFDSLRTAGVPVEQVTTFASMATVPSRGSTRLSQVRAVTAGYPLYGDVITKPAGAWGDLGTRPIALVDPSLLIALDAEVGDSLSLGFATFVIGGVVEQIPGDPGVAAAIG